jgi:hypothetical protein
VVNVWILGIIVGDVGWRGSGEDVVLREKEGMKRGEMKRPKM